MKLNSSTLVVGNHVTNIGVIVLKS